MRTLFLTLITVGLFLNGCKKENNDPQPNPIAQMWQPQSISITALANNQSLKLYLRNSNSTNLVDYSTYRMNLGMNNILTIYSAGKTDVGTWQLDKDQLVLNYGCCDKEILTVETATTTNLDLAYSISTTTTNANDLSILTGARDTYRLDTSKGVRLLFRYTPL